jgi:hypothetical protein
LIGGAHIQIVDTLCSAWRMRERVLAKRSLARLAHRDELDVHAQDKRGGPPGLAQLAGSQPLQRHEECLLHEVMCRMPIAQVAQAVESHAWRMPPAKRCFGGRIRGRAGCRNAARERGVLACSGTPGILWSIAKDA